MKTALRSVPSGGQTDPPAAALHNEAVILMTSISLCPDAVHRENCWHPQNTVPITSRRGPSQFLGSNVKFSRAISHSTQRGVMIFCSHSRGSSFYFKAQNAKNSKMGQTVLCTSNNRFTRDLLHFKISGGHTYSLKADIAVYSNQRPRQMLLLILKRNLHTASENSPPKHMRRDCAEEIFKGKRLKFSCLHFKLQISFLCRAQHTGQARFLRQCTWASSHRTMWSKALWSQVGDVVDGYLETGKKPSWFPQLCLLLGSHYGEMSFQ